MSGDRFCWLLGWLEERATQPQWCDDPLAQNLLERRGCETLDDQADHDVVLVGVVATGARRTYRLPRDVGRTSPFRGIHCWTRAGQARRVGKQLTYRHVAPDPDLSKQRSERRVERESSVIYQQQ